MGLLARIKGWSTSADSPGAVSSYQPYALYLPSPSTAPKPTPLLIALHGKQGTIYEFVFTDLPKQAERHGFIIACPSGVGGVFHTPEGERDVLNVIRDVTRTYTVDENRIYLLGISMGGRGGMYIGLRNAHLFAGIATFYGPVSGEEVGPHSHAQSNVPIFIAHGEMDSVIPIRYSEDLASRLHILAYDYRFMAIERLGHDIRVLNVSLAEMFLFFKCHGGPKSHSQHNGPVRPAHSRP